MSPETFLPAEPDEFDFQLEGFDANAAFQGAMADVATDEELALTEKVSRMEAILETGQSEIYRDFVDFRAMATQIEMHCNHDHALGDAMGLSEKISGFMDVHGDKDDHGHAIRPGHETEDKKDKKKKKKLRRGWFGIARE